jgi:hypothetical protein
MRGAIAIMGEDSGLFVRYGAFLSDIGAEVERALRRCAKPIFRFGVDDRRQQLSGNGTSN